MAVNIEQYFPALAVAQNVATITGSVSEGAKAGGYAAWIASITGSAPIPQRIEGTNRVRLVLNTSQVTAMQQWLDESVKEAFEKKEPPPVEYELGPVFGPWATKRVAPIGVGVFIIGGIAGYLLTRAL